MTRNDDSIGTILGSALRYPLSGTRFGTFGAGGLLASLLLFFLTLSYWSLRPELDPPLSVTWVPILTLGAILVSIPLTGYFVRVIRGVSAEQTKSPTFERRWALWSLGAKGLIIFVAFQRPETIRPFVSLIPFLGDLIGGPVQSFTLPILFYIYPAAIGAFAQSGSVLSAFNPRSVASILFKPEYARRAVVVVGLSALIYVFQAFLIVVLVVGLDTLALALLLSGFSLFYLRMVQHHVIGQICRHVSLEGAAASAPDSTLDRTSLAEEANALGGLHERGLLTREEYETKRRALERIERAPGMNAPEQLKSLEELHERNVLTERELEEKQRAALVEASGRPIVAPEGADRANRLDELRRLYESDVLDEDEYEAKRRELGDVAPAREDADRRREGFESAPAGELEAIYRLHAAGLLTDRELKEKRRDVLETVDVPKASADDAAVDRRRIDQLALLHRLYERGLFTDDEYERKRALLESDRTDHEPAGPRTDSEVIERFEALHRLYELGLLTDDEYAAKKRELLDRI